MPVLLPTEIIGALRRGTNFYAFFYSLGDLAWLPHISGLLSQTPPEGNCAQNESTLVCNLTWSFWPHIQTLNLLTQWSPALTLNHMQFLAFYFFKYLDIFNTQQWRFQVA